MKNITLVLLLVLPLFGMTQDKKNSWFVRPNYSFAKGNYIGYNPYMEYTQGNKFRTVYGAGIDVGRTLGKFYVSVGGGYQELGDYMMGYTIYTPPSGQGYAYDYVYTTKHYLHFGTASISGGYMDRWFYAQATFSGIKLIQGAFKTLHSAYPLIYPTWENDPDYDPNAEMNVMKPYSFAAAVSLGVNIPVVDRLSIQLGAEIRSTLDNPYDSQTGAKETFINFGGVTGLVWKFGH
jgi:hypothetical protein